jgi:Xaa-Pro aminopeptidase
MPTASIATIFAGIPAEQPALYHRVRFAVGDPAAWAEYATSNGMNQLFIVRDIEVARAKKTVKAHRIASPAEFAPASGLSPDRATATAQALAEALLRQSVKSVKVDRSLPYIFAHHLTQAGILLDYDPNLGVLERRSKDAQEVDWLREAQRVTEQAIELACRTIAHSRANKDGDLYDEEGPLTCERVKSIIASYLIVQNYGVHHGSIVATAPQSADCHESGSGTLKTETPIIVDVFPRNETTRYHGDCTRTVVHGTPSDQVKKMHQAVLDAKRAGIEAVIIGSTGEAVHRAATERLIAHGYSLSRGVITDEPSIQHGTGHGIGLEIHEPILLDDGGPEIVVGEALTVEPGLYGRRDGGVRVEDMVVATAGAAVNLNNLHEGLDWR